MEHGVRRETDYLSAFQYKDKALAYIQHAEGYIDVERRSKIDDLRELFPGYPIFPNHPTDPTLGPLRPSNPVIDPGYYLPINGPDNGDDYSYNVYSYVYNYKDHLGNIRLSYADKNNDGVISKIDKEILDENNYYPFGLEHEGYNGIFYGKENQYKYQGQERQDELSLNWDSFKWRNYDYALGRFMNVDPLAEEYAYNSTYAFQENKMGMGRELEGLELITWNDLKDAGNYIAEVGSGIVEQIDTDLANIESGINTFENNILEGNFGEALDQVARANSAGFGMQKVSTKSGETLDLSDGKEVGKAIAPIILIKATDGKTFKSAISSRAARRHAMRDAGVPTSQPLFQDKFTKSKDKVFLTRDKNFTVQDAKNDISHKGEPHWEAGPTKRDFNRPDGLNRSGGKLNKPQMRKPKGKSYYEDRK